jgi:hypothetical protein
MKFGTNMNRLAARLSAGALAGTLAAGALGCNPEAKAPTHASYAGPVQKRASTLSDRRKVSVSVYNGDFGLVREIREVDLGEGRIELEFGDVAQHIQPETVHIRSLSDPDGLSIFEQNYRYDLLNPTTLLEKYVGKRVRLHRWSEDQGKEDTVEAEVLSVNGSPVFRIGDQITYGYPGRISFPELPANLFARPSLVWLLGSDAKKQEVEVTYITRGMTWKSDYVLTVDEADARADLVGWVTLTNGSGASFEHAELKLVAGDVQRVADTTTLEFAKMAREEKQDEDKKGFKEEGLFEYHLYTLGRKTSLRQSEQKQVTLLEAAGVKVDKHLVFRGGEQYYRGELGQMVSNQKVSVFLEIQNKDDNGLGMPLPKGTVRVYKADRSGAKQFIGEDAIDHTSRDEKVKIKMGESFDVVGDRRQVNYGNLGSCRSESEWEISLRNHKDTPERVEVVEPTGGDWEIVSSSHPAAREDAHTFVFTVSVPKRGETKIKYRVRTKWC